MIRHKKNRPRNGGGAEGGGPMDREQTTIRLPAELKERLQQEADKRNQSFNGLINFLLAKGIERINQGLL